MGQVKSFRDLVVWQKAMDLVPDVYRVTKGFPSDERFCLVDQMRRAAVSVPANIAEGQRRRHRRDFRNFLSMALGSLGELETHLEIALRLSYITDAVGEALLLQTEDLAKALYGLLRSLPSDH